MDQGRQAGGELDPAFLPSVPGYEVLLGVRLIAYNLGNLWRRWALLQRMKGWRLTNLQRRLAKTGGRLVRHPRYYWLLLAKGHLSRRLFGSIPRVIAALPLPDG